MTSNFNPYRLYKLANETDNSVNFNQQEENTTKNITDNVTNPNYKNNTFNADNGAQSNTLVPEYLQGQVIYNTPKKSALENITRAFDMVKNLALIPIHAGKDRIIDNRAAELNTKAVLGTITDKEKEELDYLENRTDRYNFGIQPSVNHGVEDVAELNKNRFKKYVLQASGEGVVQIADTLKQGGIGGVVGAGVGAAGGAISGLVTGGPAGSFAGAFNGIKLGWKLGGGVGATKRAWEIETGFAYQEIKAISNDMGINIDETLAKRLSLSVGVINAGLEMIGLDSLAKTSPYFNTVLQGAKQRLLKKSITDEAFQQTILKAGERTAQLLANDTAKNTLEYSAVMGEKNAINASLSNVLSDTAVKQTQKNLIKEVTKETAKQGEEILENQSKAVVKAMITEPTTEVLQEVTNILSEELGKQIQGGYSDTVYSQNEDGSYNFNAHVARQNMARAVQAGVMALAPTIIMGGIGRGATARNIAMKNGMTRKEADEFVNRLENNTGNSILDNDAVLNIAKENAKNKKFNRNVTDRYKELISQGYSEQDAYLGAIVNVSQKMGLIADGDLVSYINQHEDTLLEIAAKEYKEDFYSEVEKQKHQEMLDNGYSQEQAFLGSTMLHAFLSANTISEQEKQNVLNSLYFKKETSEQTQSNELVLNQPMLEGINPEQNVDVVDLTSNFATDSQLSKKDLSNYIQSLIGSKPLTTKDKKAILNFVARSKRVGKKDVLVSEHIVNSSKVEKNNKLERNTSIKNIVDLIKSSVIVEKTENKDKKTKPNVDNYLRFYVPIKINDNIFTVRIVAENNKNNNIFNIEVGNVYDLIIDKKMTYSTSPDNQGNLGKSSSNNIIADNSENFNPKQITIRKMLKDVEDTDGNVYFQTGIEDIDNSEKYKNLPQELKDAIDYIFTGKSVYDVTGEEFPNNGKNLNERVFNYYKENFNNVITVDNIGKIKLDKRSIKDSTFHGLSENKANAFAAVPYVLQQGKIVDVTKENNQNEKRYLFVAPITLKGDDYFCEVVVKSNKDRQGFYIHEVELKEKLADVFSTAHHGTSTSSKSIIADLVNNFNPNEQLKNKIFNDTDLAGTNRKRHKTIEEIHEDVRARRTGEQYRGYFKSGKYSSIITLAENADATTIIHELGHFFLKTLNDLSAGNKDIRDKLVAVDSWLGREAGEDYTVSQQEKFATGFEAYLYMGKAPSRRIKSAFEMFKEWIKGIVNQDLLKRIDEHNIHAFEVRDVFDRIFNPNNEVYEEKRDRVREILNKVAKIRIGKGLNDVQKRHRECAYQIVSMATGKNIKYLKTILQSNSDSKRILNAKEKIYNLCAECDDKLSVNSYPMEWLEFYGNNENLFQEGNDAELALRAFDDIVNKNYVTEVDEWSYIDSLDAQYQYLIKQYENAKQEDKDIVFSAIMEWIDDIGNTDAMASEIYIEKLGFDLDEIDRLKNMDEFELAKEKILKSAREIAYNTPNKDEQFRKTVLAVFDGLKFLTLSDKMKLAATVLECPNLTFLEARIDNIMDIAKTMLEVNERKKLYRLISDEVAGTKNIKQNNRMVGKYDYRTNKLFEQLRILDKMTREQLQEWLDANDAFEEIKETEENKKSELESEFDKKLKRRYARIKSESAADIDVEILKGMYDDLRKIKLTARNVKNEQELYDRLERTNERDEVLKVLRQRKDNENIVKKGYLNLFANWESSLNTVFNLDIRNKYSALAQETKADGWAFEQKSKFEDDIAKIYGLRGWNFDKEVLKNLKTTFKVEQYTYRPARNGEYIVTPVTVTMNKMEILLAYMWDKNEVLHERMINQFGEEHLFDLFDELTPQDKALGDLMLKRINEFYPQANKVFIKKYGIDLPKVQAYFPSVADRFNEVDLLNDYRQRSTAPTFTKERSASTFIPLKFSNPINMFYKHIDDMSKFIYMSDIGDRINHVFRDNVVQKEIKERFGQRALRTFNQNMENFLYPQYRKSDELLRFLNSFITNIIASNVAIRPVVAFKQLLSACNYSTEMPADLWVKGFMNCLLHPQKTINYMMKIPYLNARFNMGGSDEFSKNMIDNMQTSSLKKLQNLLMVNVRFGDMGAIVFGGKPYIDYLINNEGLTEQEAIDKFILQTQRTQQSSAISSLSVWQQNANTNPIWKMLTAYKNTANQYVRLCVDSVINAMNGDVSWKYAGKNLFMYLWLQPFLYICATNLGFLRYFNTGDDDGLKQDFMSSLFDWNKTALAIIGDVLQNVQNAVITGEVSRLYSSNEILNNLGKAMYDLLTDGVQTEDIVSVIAFLLNTKVRVPVKSVMDMASSVGDFADREFQKGFLKLMGYSSYRAAYAMGEDNEYLKQKRKETQKKKKQRKLNRE